MKFTLSSKLRAVSGAIALSLAGLAATPVMAEKVIVTHSTKSFAFLTYFAASAMNYFDDMGIEVEEIRTGSGSKSLAAMVSGDAHIYLGSTASAFKSRAKGVPVRLIAPVVTQLTSSIVVTGDWAKSHGITKDSPLEDKMAALKDARIAISGPGSGSDQAARYVIAQAGFNPDRDTQLVAMGSNATTYMSAMQAGQIDGFSTSPPHIHVAEKDFGATILINMAAGELPALDGYFYIGMIARDDWVASNPEDAAKVVAGLRMAMEAIHDPARNAEVADAVYNKYYPDMDRALFNRVWEDQTNSVPTSLDMSDEMLKRVISFYNTFSDNKIDEAQISDVVTRQVIDAADALLTTN